MASMSAATSLAFSPFAFAEAASAKPGMNDAPTSEGIASVFSVFSEGIAGIAGGAAEGTVALGSDGFLGIADVSRSLATPRGPRRTASKSSLIFTAILSFTEGSCVGGRSDVLAVSNIECVRFALRSQSSRTDTGAGEAATAEPPRSPPRGAIARFFTRASACRE